MKNPWLKLSLKPPYILEEDKDIINEFNKKANQNNYIFTNSLAKPFCGNPLKATIILLQLNPGTDNPKGFNNDNDGGDDFIGLNIPGYKSDIYKNIKHKKIAYPFVDLNPKYRLSGGFRYWADKISPFIESKEDYKKISNKICCLEFFPYHSKNYKYLGEILECQKYNFELLEKAMDRDAIIIVMRGLKQWLPKLKQYKYITLRSKRNVILSKKNLGKNFDLIQKALE